MIAVVGKPGMSWLFMSFNALISPSGADQQKAGIVEARSMVMVIAYPY